MGRPKQTEIQRYLTGFNNLIDYKNQNKAECKANISEHNVWFLIDVGGCKVLTVHA